MTRKEFKKSVWNTCISVMRKHSIRLQDVVIDHRLPFIAINDIFSAQGDSAIDLINSVPDDVNERVWLLYYLDSAGAI